MRSLKTHICFLLLLCNYTLLENHDAFFIFGDSNFFFYAGNNNYISTTVNYEANFWPYGENFLRTLLAKFPIGILCQSLLVKDFKEKGSFFLDQPRCKTTYSQRKGLPSVAPYYLVTIN